MPTYALAVMLTILAGASIATQQIFNGGLRNALGSVWWAGLISYLGGDSVHARGAVHDRRASAVHVDT